MSHHFPADGGLVRCVPTGSDGLSAAADEILILPRML